MTESPPIVDRRPVRRRNRGIKANVFRTGVAVIAAFLVAGTEAVTISYLDASWVLLTQFGLIAIVLLVRPRGVAGILEATRA